MTYPASLISRQSMRSVSCNALRRLVTAFVIAGSTFGVGQAAAATALADQPLFANPFVPGNLGLVLSVEYPTAVSVAHTNQTYAAANQYLGYFDPDKCYDYRYTDGIGTDNYYYPVGLASNHACAGKWSGNFLNWATMQTIDPFRWVLTGGYRIIDEPSLTVLEKAWASGQGGGSNFPDRSLSGSDLAGATPFPASAGRVGIHIHSLGNKMRFTTPDAGGNVSFNAQYYQNRNLAGSPILTQTEPSIDYNRNGVWPNASLPMDGVSGRWTAKVSAPTTGTYTFRVRADDGVRLTVDGQTLPGGADVGWKDQGATNYDSAALNVAAGHVFDVVVEWYQSGGGAEISLQWKRPGDSDFGLTGSILPSFDGSATAYRGTAAPLASGTVYEAFVRMKVCDPSQREANCTAYANGNYKPEGLLQQYSNKIRYSTFGYLNTSSNFRDGGVLRAQQKFVGPLKPVPGSPAAVNDAREWDGTTGVFIANPDSADASASAVIWGNTVNSGVLNYLNKFGEINRGDYKLNDPVSELYYAALRYFKAMPDVPEWTSTQGLDASEKLKLADGFPVITGAADPILYSCQRNFILGIGDVNTNADKNVPGRLAGQTGSEPSLPAAVAADTSIDAVAVTDMLGNLEGLGNIGSNATYNTPAIAGLAYDAHVKDIRPDDPAKPLQTLGKQTIDTYWVDVMEYQRYVNNNMFYLATKYGGFTVPTGYNYGDPLAQESWWHTTPDTVGSQKRPDNYYSGGRPDLVRAGLQAAFLKIAAAITSFTTSFSTSLPQVATAGNSSFASKYDPNTWTGEIVASSLTFDANYAPSITAKWNLSDRLATQLAGNGWNTRRRLLTWNGTRGVAFRASGTGTTQVLDSDLATLDTPYVASNDAVAYLNYLRGDQTNEIGSTASTSTRAYRARGKLLGDVVGSKAKPVGAPSFPYSDATNPGYSAFKTRWASRRTVVYFGSNDGILHAVNGALDAATDSNFGQEMFGYVPRALFAGPSGSPATDGLASLGNPSFTHHFMVNATPLIYDIDMSRAAGSSGSSDWRSVLIGGLGKGGKSYFALDVTDPVSMASSSEDAIASKVLWEFTDPALGYTYGDPLVMKTQKYGWVVVLPSGYNNSDGMGYFLFVNPRDGSLLAKVATGAGSTANDAGLAHANAFIVDSSDGTADAIYAGDLLGNVWRLDVTGTSDYTTASRLTKLAVLTDATSAHNPQPVTSRPSIQVHPQTKKRFVMFGTGRLLDPTDVASTQPQTFYSFVDGYNANFGVSTALPSGVSYPYTRSVLAANDNALTTGASFDATTQAGWYEELGLGSGSSIGWRVTSDATTFNGAVAFSATLPNGSVCAPSGESRVYARDYSTAVTTLQTTANSSTLPIAFAPTAGTVTDLRYLSVSGHAVLISGTDIGNVANVEIKPASPLSLRRINWRELQNVD